MNTNTNFQGSLEWAKTLSQLMTPCSVRCRPSHEDREVRSLLAALTRSAKAPSPSVGCSCTPACC